MVKILIDNGHGVNTKGKQSPDGRLREYAFAREIARSGVCVEINTGGIARSNLKEPYPSLYFLELLKEKNVPVTINSDAHDADKIDYWFDEAESFAIKARYKEIGYFENGQLKFRSI